MPGVIRTDLHGNKQQLNDGRWQLVPETKVLLLITYDMTPAYENAIADFSHYDWPTESSSILTVIIFLIGACSLLER